MIDRVLHRLLAANADWERGDSLSLLNVDEATSAELGKLLRYAVEDGTLRSRGGQAEMAGAALMLFGARVFGRSSSPFTYDLIGQAMSVVDLANKLGGNSRENMERGLGRRLGLQVLHAGDGSRRFRGTMLFHSGAAWSLVLDVLRILGRRFGFESLRHDTAKTLAQLVVDLASGAELKDSQRIALGHTETQVAVAEQVRLAIEARDWLVRDGLVASTADATAEAARHAELDLRVLLGASTEAAVADLLGILFPFGDKTGASSAIIDWRVDVSSGVVPHLTIEVPPQIRLDGIPSDVERVRLLCVGGEDDPSRRPLLRRTGDLFEHFQGPTVLRIPRPLRVPVVVHAEYRRGGEHREVEAVSVSLPDDDVVLFDLATGRRCRRSVPGTRVALVCPPGAQIIDLQGFDRAHPPGAGVCEMWIGDIPPHPVQFLLRTGQGDHEQWLTPAGLGVSLHLHGEEVPGLRDGAARCFKTWPRIRAGASGTLTCRLEGPRGELPVARRRGEIRPPPRAIPGRYRVILEQAPIRVSRPFILLPEGARFTATSSRASTRLEASVSAEPVTLRCRTTGSQGDGLLELGTDTRGPIELTATVPFGEAGGERTHLAWHVLATPHRIVVLEARGGAPTESSNMGLLRGSGGILVHGRPSAEVLFDVDGHRFRQRLDGDGERFFPFSSVPPQAFPPGDQPVRIRVEMDGASFPLRPFVDSTTAHPTVSTSKDADGRTLVLVRTQQAYPEPVVFEAVPAWKPWAEPWTSPASAVRDERGISYVAPLDVEPGPHIVTLTRNERRVVGMALVHEREPSEPPANLDPLERALWGNIVPPDEELEELLRDRLRAEGHLHLLASLFIRLDRYGAMWFRIHRAILNSASHHRLEALLGLAEPVVSDLIARVFRDLGAPPAAVRYSDFAFVHETGSPSPEKLLMWLEQLSPLSSGLVLPAWVAWSSHVPESELPRFMGLLGSLVEVQQPLRLLSQDELDLVQTPPPESLDLDSAVSLRARALVEARRAGQRLRDSDGRRADSLRRILRDAQPPSSAGILGPLSARNQKGIPESVLSIERAVSAACIQIHEWRARVPGARVRWEDARLLWEDFPLLLDYWLNRLSTQVTAGAR